MDSKIKTERDYLDEVIDQLMNEVQCNDSEHIESENLLPIKRQNTTRRKS